MALASLAAARALARQVADMEEEDIPEARLDALRRDPEWLQLPLGRRHGALRRYRILSGYDRLASPTKADAVKAAGRLGVQLRSFYALLREWRDRGRTPLALVRYRTDETSPRPSRLDPAIAKRLLDDVRALLRRDPGVSTGDAARTINEGWPRDLKAPSGVTVRAYVERERAGAAPAPKQARIEFGRTEEAVTATRFGEVIVIDHASPSRLLLLPQFGAAAVAPTITLAIDLVSGTPIGAAVSEVEPGPEAVLDALADAKARMEALGDGGAIRPRLVYAAPPDQAWQALRETLAAEGLDVVVGLDHRMPFGAATRKLVGARLGTVPLAATFARRPRAGDIDLDQDALLTANQVRWLVNASVDDAISQRLPKAEGQRGARLDLPASLDARGSLRSRTRPLIEFPAHDDGPTDIPVARVDTAPDAQTRKHARTTVDVLRAIVAREVGTAAARTDVEEPTGDNPGWLVRVEVEDGSAMPDLWLSLARAAVRLADERGTKVRFDVFTKAVAQSGTRHLDDPSSERS